MPLRNAVAAVSVGLVTPPPPVYTADHADEAQAGSSSTRSGALCTSASDLKVSELKALLKEGGLPVNGVKADLVDRLEQHWNAQNSEKEKDQIQSNSSSSSSSSSVNHDSSSSSSSEPVLLVDILGTEDHYGDMDFKIAGDHTTKNTCDSYLHLTCT